MSIKSLSSDLVAHVNLYDLLEACNNEELAAIVDILVVSPVSVLKLTRSFEKHQPNHHLYTDQIGDETYRLAVKVLGCTSGVRPTYQAMVAGLCKQIGFTASESVEDNEAVLLNTFSKRHLLSVPPPLRQGLINEAGEAAAKAAGSWLVDEWKPYAAVLLQVMFLRRELAARKRAGSDPRLESAGVATADSSDTAITIQAVDGASILSLDRLPDPASEGWRTFSDRGRVETAMLPVLEAIKPLFSAERVIATGNCMRVTIPKGARLDKIAGSDAFFGRARNAAGRLQEFRLDPVSALTLATPLAFVTLAAAIAQQKQQERLEKSLDEIKAGVTDVTRFQKAERRAVLTGSVRYFQQIAPSVLNGEVPDELLGEIERHEVELLRVQEHLVADLATQIDALRALKNEGWTSGKFVKSLQATQSVLGKTYEELLLCLRARACGFQLMCAFPGRELGKQARYKDICDALARFSADGDATVALGQALREKLADISSFDIKAALLKHENETVEQYANGRAAILASLDAIGRDDGGEDIRLDVRFEDHRPIAMRLV